MTGLAAFWKVTLPGPLVTVHVVVTTAPVGRPSSLTEPASAAPAGSAIVCDGPALTTGARFTGGAALTTITTSSEARNSPWNAVSRRTYLPASVKLAVVFGLALFANVTVPGPLTPLHATVRFPQPSRRSSSRPS